MNFARISQSPYSQLVTLLLIAGTLLSGCAVSTVTTTDQPPSVPGAVTSAGQGAPEPPPVSTNEVGNASSPIDAAAGKPAVGQQFLTAAQAAQQAEDWPTAIEQAELGLRIDRRQPQLYLVLAQSYWQMGKAAMASQFARQGLRYLAGGSEVLQQQLEGLAYP